MSYHATHTHAMNAFIPSEVCEALAASSVDPVQLYMRAMNHLSRCKQMMLADEPPYQQVLETLTAVHSAVVALANMHMPSAS